MKSNVFRKSFLNEYQNHKKSLQKLNIMLNLSDKQAVILTSVTQKNVLSAKLINYRVRHGKLGFLN